MFINSEHHVAIQINPKNMTLQKRMLLKSHGYTDGYDNERLSHDGLTRNKISIEYIRNILDIIIMLDPECKNVNMYVTMDKFLVIENNDHNISGFIAGIMNTDTGHQD